MKLHIKNLAKIREADIELNGITVIAGENNTGKSTVGKTLYSIYEAFYGIHDKIEFEKQSALYNFLRRSEFSINRTLIKKIIIPYILSIEPSIYQDEEKLNDVLSNYSSSNSINLLDIDNALEHIYRILNMKDETIRTTIVKKCFDTEFHQQLQSFYSKEQPYVEMKLKNDKIKLDFSKTNIVEEYVNILYKLIYIDNPKIMDELDGLVYINQYLEHETYEHDRLLKHLLLESKSNQNIVDEIMAKEALSNVLNKLGEVLQGEFIKTAEGITFKEKDSDTPLHLTNLSTGLKSFAIIKRLIENGHIQQNGILVLDEPEVNLHPKWQLIYAEILVILQKEFQLHILLTTHSPYFINAIEVFSAKHKIADKCKYYLSGLENHCAYFDDVTTRIDKIYEKLAMPLQELEDIDLE